MPASGYYEWLDTPDGKQPFYFTRADGGVMTLAAIQDVWLNPETSDRVRSCAMVIGQPNKLVAEVHDRMPIILEAKDFDQWERGEVKDAAALMKPAADGMLQRHAVSRRVNSSRADANDATLIHHIGSPTLTI